MNRRLSRCRDNRVLAGVAAGVAEFFGIDPTLVRVLWFVSAFFGGFTILLYVGLAIIVPLEPATDAAGAAIHDPASAAAALEAHAHRQRASGRLTTIFGVALILLGSLALIGALVPDIHAWRYLGPVFVIGLGAILVVAAMRRDPSPAAAVPPAPQEPIQS